MTGITDDMLEKAPSFSEIAQEVHDFLQDAVFVAHNVNFDFSFLKECFHKEGLVWNPKKLCTVRLSRKIFPGLPSYSLGRLCESLHIVNPSPHRAWGDTQATAELFGKLLQADTEALISKSLKKSDPDAFLPPSVPSEIWATLPDEAGVYYFLDDKGKILYIGKAKNIRQRIRSHFNGQYLNFFRQELVKKVADIHFELTGTELIALLLEDQEIRKHWPPLNRSQKLKSRQFGVYIYTDGKSKLRLALQHTSGLNGALRVFDSYGTGREWMMNFVVDNDLPMACCGIEDEQQVNFNEDWNVDLQNAVNKLLAQKDTFIIPGDGRDEEEQSFILVENSVPVSYGFLPKHAAIRNREELDTYAKPLDSSGLGQQILLGYMERNNLFKVPFF
jgi:DNA polymerase-3 subunit epsilon